MSRRRKGTRREVNADVAAQIFIRDQGICQLCLQPVDPDLPFTIDHIIPISKGGDKYNIRNMQLVHVACNILKGEAIVERGLFSAISGVIDHGDLQPELGAGGKPSKRSRKIKELQAQFKL